MPDRFYNALLDLGDNAGHATLHMATYVARQLNGLHTVDLWGHEFPDTVALGTFSTPPGRGATVAVLKTGQSLLLLGGVAGTLDPTWWWVAEDITASPVTIWPSRVGPALAAWPDSTGPDPEKVGAAVVMSEEWTGGFFAADADTSTTTADGWLLYVVANPGTGEGATVANMLYAQAVDNTGPYVGLTGLDENNLRLDAYAADGPNYAESLFPPGDGSAALHPGRINVVEVALPAGGALTARVNGTDLPAHVRFAAGAIGDIVLGEVYVGSYWDALLYEVIFYNDASDEHRAEARAYLAQRYGVPT
jgi:hypothetical protein